MFKAFIFIYDFQDLHNELEKMTKNAIFFATNFLFISPFACFSEKPLLFNATLLHCMKPSFGKIGN